MMVNALILSAFGGDRSQPEEQGDNRYSEVAVTPLRILIPRTAVLW